MNKTIDERLQFITQSSLQGVDMLRKSLGAEPYHLEKIPDNPTASVCDRPAPVSPATLKQRPVVGKRQEPRYPTMGTVEVCILESDFQRVIGTVLDASRKELRIEVATPISKGARLEIVIHHRAIICGVARYCIRTEGRAEFGYRVGLVIRDIYYAQPIFSRHLHDDQLTLYLVGKGLTVMDIIHVKDHLVACEDCLRRLYETETVLRARQAVVKTKCWSDAKRIR